VIHEYYISAVARFLPSLDQNPPRGPIKVTRHHCLRTTPGHLVPISPHNLPDNLSSLSLTRDKEFKNAYQKMSSSPEGFFFLRNNFIISHAKVISIFVHIGNGKVGKLFSNQGNPLSSMKNEITVVFFGFQVRFGKT
jgi:hypothetical protein